MFMWFRRRFLGCIGLVLLTLGVWRSTVQNLCGFQLINEIDAFGVLPPSFPLNEHDDAGVVPVSATLDWKAKFLQNDLIASWQCDRHPALREFNFTDFPLHSIPARGSLPHASIFAETQWAKCDLLSSPDDCKRISDGAPESPDTWIEEWMDEIIPNDNIVKYGVDVGANMGLVSVRLLQKGITRLVSVEPQPDLCCAGRRTAEYNRYGDNSLFMCGGLSPEDELRNSTLQLSDKLWRTGGRFPSLRFWQEHGLPSLVPLFSFGDVFLHQPPRHYTFIKLDTDSVDCLLLRRLVDEQRAGRLSFDTVTLETLFRPLCSNNELFSQLLADLQEDGYSIYRAPAERGGEREVWERWPIPEDKYAHLNEAHVLLPTTTLFKFKTFPLERWRTIHKAWRKQFQIAISKISLTHLEQPL